VRNIGGLCGPFRIPALYYIAKEFLTHIPGDGQPVDGLEAPSSLASRRRTYPRSGRNALGKWPVQSPCPRPKGWPASGLVTGRRLIPEELVIGDKHVLGIMCHEVQDRL
jgi:hypothetical protein